MHFLLHDLAWLSFFILPCLNFGSGGSESSTTTETNTSSGPNSPNASAGSQSVGSGSIAVAGAGAKYIEQGASDLQGAQVGGLSTKGNVTLQGGSILNIGDPNADKLIAQLANQVAGSTGSTTTVIPGAGSGGSGSSISSLLPENINWTLIGLVVAVLIAVLIFFKRKP